MDFGFSTVFNIIGKGISIAKAIWKIINDVKALQEQRRQLQRQLSVLINILESIRAVDTLKDPRVAGELQKALGNLDLILEDVAEACASFDFAKALAALKSFSGEDEGFLKRLLKKIRQAKELGDIVLSAEGKAKVLVVLDQRLKLALSIVQIGFSCTQLRQTKNLGVRLRTGFRELTYTPDDTLEIYTDPLNGSGVPKPVTNVKAEVNSQRLIIFWKGSSVEDDTASTKYEVRYDEQKHSIVTCAKSPVALGSQRIEPWRDYTVQVRAVNDAGASRWSFPPVYVRMNEGAPNPPSFVVFEAVARTSLNVIAEEPPDEQAVTHVIVEKLKAGSDQVQWDFEESKVDGDFEHTLRGLDPSTEYLIRARFRNRFDVSEPSAAVLVKINGMLPNEPLQLELFPGNDAVHLKPEIRFIPPTLNVGAIDKYVVKLKEKGSNAISFELDGSKEADRTTGVLSIPIDMKIDPKSESMRYKMTVRAVAKKGSVKTVGYLSLPPKETPTNILAQSALAVMTGFSSCLVVQDPKVSAVFTNPDNDLMQLTE